MRQLAFVSHTYPVRLSSHNSLKRSPIRLIPASPQHNQSLQHAFSPHNYHAQLRFPSPLCVISSRPLLVWLRLGDLRLADNRAIAALASSTRAVLPIVTICRSSVSDLVLSAIADLGVTLRSLGSTILVRIVDDAFSAEVVAVHDVAQRIRAASVHLHSSSKVDFSALQYLRARNVNVYCEERNSTLSPQTSCKRPFLSDVPHSFPRPPSSADALQSDFNWTHFSCCGETQARSKLSRLVAMYRAPRAVHYQIAMVVCQLTDEIRLGCISRDRIIFECTQSSAASPEESKRLSTPLRALFNRFKQTPAFAALSVAAYDVNCGDRRGVEWDEETNSFRLKEWEHTENERRMNVQERCQEFIRRRRMFLMRAFFPEDVSPDYYSFTAWRFAQRCVSATIGVFGTSSLLLALGIRSGRIGQAAVISWVLKDGLGRVGKMIWAGSMGKDFDVDPKRWRFRSALLYALGNGLEIVTQIFPASFLVFATAANSMKQVSMITSSATRNAMYRSFGGRSQNIANITAKGEAQITVADLIGMGCGIGLGKIVGNSRRNIVGSFMLLTLMDIFGIYMELRMVVFRTFNTERSDFVVQQFVQNGQVMTPAEVSRKESIFLRPSYKNRTRLSSIAKAARSPEELDLLLRIFRREHFMVATPSGGSSPCRIVLRRDANNEDVLRAMLLVGYVHKMIGSRKEKKGKKAKKELTLEEEECILRSARKSSRRAFPLFLKEAREAGWNTDNLLFGNLKRRGYWGRE